LQVHVKAVLAAMIFQVLAALFQIIELHKLGILNIRYSR